MEGQTPQQLELLEVQEQALARKKAKRSQVQEQVQELLEARKKGGGVSQQLEPLVVQEQRQL